jgi:hypothetical protein
MHRICRSLGPIQSNNVGLGLLQTDQYCKNSGWEIIGYYQANEGLNDNAPDFVASRIAEKLAEVNPNILVLMVRDFINFN